MKTVKRTLLAALMAAAVLIITACSAGSASSSSSSSSEDGDSSALPPSVTETASLSCTLLPLPDDGSGADGDENPWYRMTTSEDGVCYAVQPEGQPLMLLPVEDTVIYTISAGECTLKDVTLSVEQDGSTEVIRQYQLYVLADAGGGEEAVS